MLNVFHIREFSCPAARFTRLDSGQDLPISRRNDEVAGVIIISMESFPRRYKLGVIASWLPRDQFVPYVPTPSGYDYQYRL